LNVGPFYLDHIVKRYVENSIFFRKTACAKVGGVGYRESKNSLVGFYNKETLRRQKIIEASFSLEKST